MIRKLKQLLTSYVSRVEETLNLITIKQDAILHNLSTLQSKKWEDGIFPVLKSNAYGHGLQQISSILRKTQVPYICVDSFPEYQIVKTYAKKKILILGETLPSNYKHYDPHRATPAVYSPSSLQALIASWQQWDIHLFLNTGMNREWIDMTFLPEILSLLRTHKHIHIEWVMSHFANADEQDFSYCTTQIERFKKMTAMIRDHWFTPKYFHSGNSAWRSKIDDPLFNAWRPWLAFYGYTPLENTDQYNIAYADLRPALDVYSTIVSIHTLHPGEIVSYWWKRSTTKQTTTATIPFGYYEWLPRILTNKRSVKLWDTYLPLIWTICMNLSCVHDELKQCKQGSRVQIFSSSPKDKNSLSVAAKNAGTIPYEILVKINEKIRREII